MTASVAALKAPRVFVSYSHDSAEHAGRVLALADQLRRDGVYARIDQYVAKPAKGRWTRWMVDEIKTADHVLAICTAKYRRRFEGDETNGGQGVDWEGAIRTEKLYARERELVVPVVFVRADLEHLPDVLQGLAHYVLGDVKGYEELLRHLTNCDVSCGRPLRRWVGQAGDRTHPAEVDSGAARLNRSSLTAWSGEGGRFARVPIAANPSGNSELRTLNSELRSLAIAPPTVGWRRLIAASLHIRLHRPA